MFIKQRNKNKDKQENAKLGWLLQAKFSINSIQYKSLASLCCPGKQGIWKKQTTFENKNEN